MVLSAHGLTAAYGAKTVLEGLSLELEAGERFCLLGPNAAGKTTFLRVLLGLVPASAGNFALAEDRVGAVLENPGVFRLSSARAYLRFHAKLQGVKMSDARADELMSAWELPDVPWSALSLGQRQRLQIARALVPSPRLLLLDEPSANLDPVSRGELWDRLTAWCAAGNTLLWTSHDLSEAMARAGRLGVLAAGKLRFAGTPAEFVGAFPGSLACRAEDDDAPERCRAVLGGEASVQEVEGGLRLRSKLPAPELLRRLVGAGIRISFFGPDESSFLDSYREALECSPLLMETPSLSAVHPPQLTDGWRTVPTVARWELSLLVREPRVFVPFVFFAAVALSAQALLHVSMVPALCILPLSLGASLTADLVAGERERQGLETLLSEIPASAALAGKILAAWIGSLLLLLFVIPAGLLPSGRWTFSPWAALVMTLSLSALSLSAVLASARIAAGSRTVRSASQLSVFAAIGIYFIGMALLVRGMMVPDPAAEFRWLLVLSLCLPLLFMLMMPGAVRRYREVW